MGALDARGVWIYDNDDQIVPHAAYENLGQVSISNALATLRTDLTVADTGWVNITLASGWTVLGGETPQVRRIGNFVGYRGAATNASAGTGNVTIATGIAAQFRPGFMIEAIGYAGAGAFYRGTISNTGTVAANNFAGTSFRFSIFNSFMV